MFKKSIIFFIAGITAPYFGGWLAGALLLGNGETPNFLPIQLASMLTIFLSVGLFYLSQIEKRRNIRFLCLSVAIIYAVLHLGILIPQGTQSHYLWWYLIYFWKILIGVMIGVVCLGFKKEFQNEI